MGDLMAVISDILAGPATFRIEEDNDICLGFSIFSL
jgi:hypothetical protein